MSLNSKKMFVFFILTYSVVVLAATKDTLQEVEEIFEDIENRHNQLRNIIESAIESGPQGMVDVKPTITPKNIVDCVCVPLYLCNDDGIIKKDGSNIIRQRISDEGDDVKCQNPIDVCCKEPVEQSNPASTCGLSGYNMNNEVRKEPDTSLFGELPWTVMVLENSVNYVCAGALLHPQVILTAAHCINSTMNYTIRAGEWDVRDRNEPIPHQSQLVKTIIKHPDFNANNLHYDAAVLILPEPLKLAKNVNAICIDEYPPYVSKTFHNNCLASGWGFDKTTNAYKRVMKRIEFSLVNHKACEERIRTTTHLGKWFELHKSFLCASGKNGFDVCAGDGGGPLVCPVPDTPNRYHLVGVTSWGVGCADKTPSVFVRVSEIKQWIDGWFDYYEFNKDYAYESLKIEF